MIHRLTKSVVLAAVLLAAPTLTGASERFFVALAETNTPVVGGDVLDVAAATGQFVTFLDAVEAAGMEETLRGEGPFTLFAPTDEAFRRTSQGELESLLQPERRDDLVAFVAYHVVHERVTAESVGARVSNVESTSGDFVRVDGRDGMRVNDELVVMPDIDAQNGVIHGLNAVLSPPVLIARR